MHLAANVPRGMIGGGTVLRTVVMVWAVVVIHRVVHRRENSLDMILTSLIQDDQLDKSTPSSIRVHSSCPVRVHISIWG